MQPKIFSLIDKATAEFSLLPKGSKILVGASGGKDSTLLIEYFSKRLKRGEDFSFEALYIKTDFADEFNPILRKTMEDWGVSVKTLEVDTLNRVKEGEKMNCWWCSTQRRKELLNYALKNGFSAIALGHHLDDILETFLMNTAEKGVLSTMKPLFRYDRYPISIIRPLCYCPVSEILNHANENGWQKIVCTCNYQNNSGRKTARNRLAALTDGDEKAKWRIFSALKNAGLLS